MASSAQNILISGPPPAVPLSTCAKRLHEMVVDYNPDSRADPSPNNPAYRIDEMIGELAARLDARVATDAHILESNLILSPQEFSIFQRLPTELSDKIWNFAATNQPHRVEIEHNGITDRFNRVTLYERNPPIILRHVCKQLRDMLPKVLGYSVLNLKSPVYDKSCSNWFHPDIDMLSISRTYENDTQRASPESSQHTMATINALKKEEVLDGIKYFAMNERILCKISWHLLPPTSCEPASSHWHLNIHDGDQNAANPLVYGQINALDLRERTSIISKFPNLELLLSINTRCRHPARLSMDLDDTPVEFERCLPDRPREIGDDGHFCKSRCYRVHKYIITQAIRENETTPHILMVHDARRNSPTGGKFSKGGC
ncbi:hypothetical protein IFR04_009851 [Cadophora malorum]|uniref:2EXR domain-containing protein n=1 Tax=Cadophora malorum TaxID=108018 RepID=A0A8H7W4L2_9HELO|nr:hypothetical protein IFR04_009851 [Cadophora malorum]